MSKKMWHKIFKTKSAKNAKTLSPTTTTTVAAAANKQNKRCSIYDEYQQLQAAGSAEQKQQKVLKVNSATTKHSTATDTIATTANTTTTTKTAATTTKTSATIAAATTTTSTNNTAAATTFPTNISTATSNDELPLPAIVAAAAAAATAAANAVPPKSQSTFSKVVNTFTLKRNAKEQQQQQHNIEHGSNNSKTNKSATIKNDNNSSNTNNREFIEAAPTTTTATRQILIVVNKLVCDPNVAVAANTTHVVANNAAAAAQLTRTHVTTNHSSATNPTAFQNPQTYDNNSILAEFDEQASTGASTTQLTPCPICSRTFNPVTLQKHVGICQKMASKRRNTFDSQRQRREGTELASYPLPKDYGLPPIKHERAHSPKPAQVSSPILTRKKPTQEDFARTTARTSMRKLAGGGGSSSTTTALTTPTTAAPSTAAATSSGAASNFTRDRMRSSERSLAKRIQAPAAEQCPHCDRCFGIKAYDRHVEWCKEKALQASIKQTTKTEQNVAKERLEARTKYRAPCLKTKRSINRDKYSGFGEENDYIESPKSTNSTNNNIMSLSMTSSLMSDSTQMQNANHGNANGPRNNSRNRSQNKNNNDNTSNTTHNSKNNNNKSNKNSSSNSHNVADELSISSNSKIKDVRRTAAAALESTLPDFRIDGERCNMKQQSTASSTSARGKYKNVVAVPTLVDATFYVSDHVDVGTDHSNVASEHDEIVTDRYDIADDHYDVADDHYDIADDHYNAAADRYDVASDHYDVAADDYDVDADHYDINVDNVDVAKNVAVSRRIKHANDTVSASDTQDHQKELAASDSQSKDLLATLTFGTIARTTTTATEATTNKATKPTTPRLESSKSSTSLNKRKLKTKQKWGINSSTTEKNDVLATAADASSAAASATSVTNEPKNNSGAGGGGNAKYSAASIALLKNAIFETTPKTATTPTTSAILAATSATTTTPTRTSTTSMSVHTKLETNPIKSPAICRPKRKKLLRPPNSTSAPLKAIPLLKESIEIFGMPASKVPTLAAIDKSHGTKEIRVIKAPPMPIPMPPPLTRNKSFVLSGLPDNYDPFLSAKRQLEDLCSPTIPSNPLDAFSYNAPKTPLTPKNPNNPLSTPSTPLPMAQPNKLTSSLMSLSATTPNYSPPVQPNNNAMTTSLNKTSSFRRTSSLRGPRRTPPMLASRPPLFATKYRPTIQRGLSDEGPISNNFLKPEEYDEMPVRSVCVNDFAVTKSPRVVRRDTSASNRKHNLKLSIEGAGGQAEVNPTASKYLSKTDSLAVFLKYEHELEKLPTTVEDATPTQAVTDATEKVQSSISPTEIISNSPVITKELKDKSNTLSKQNSAKNIIAEAQESLKRAEICEQQMRRNSVEQMLVPASPKNNENLNLTNKLNNQIRLEPMTLTPASKPSTPLTNPTTTPLLQSTTLLQKPATSLSKPATPLPKPATPLSMPTTPLSKPVTPVSQSTVPLSRPATHCSQPISQNPPLTQPSTLFSNPMTPLVPKYIPYVGSTATTLPAMTQQINLHAIFGDSKSASTPSDFIDPKLINKCDNLPVSIASGRAVQQDTETTAISQEQRHSEISTSPLVTEANTVATATPHSKLSKLLPLHTQATDIVKRTQNTGASSVCPASNHTVTSTPSSQRNSAEGRNLLKRKMRLGRNQFLYDLSPDADDCSADDEANRSSMEFDDYRSKNHHISNTHSKPANTNPQIQHIPQASPPSIPPLPIFDDFDFEEFLSSFENDDDQFPLFKDCRDFLMNRTSNKQRSTVTPNSVNNNSSSNTFNFNNITTSTPQSNSNSNSSNNNNPTYQQYSPNPHTQQFPHYPLASLLNHKYSHSPLLTTSSNSTSTHPAVNSKEFVTSSNTDKYDVPKSEAETEQKKREIFISIETEQNDQGRTAISPNSLRTIMGSNQKAHVEEVDANDNKFSKIEDDGDEPLLTSSTNSTFFSASKHFPNIQLNNAKNLIQKMQDDFRQMGEEVGENLRQAVVNSARASTAPTMSSALGGVADTGYAAKNAQSGDANADSDDMSSLESYPMSSQSSRRGVASKLSADSAYGSLSRQRSSELTTPRLNRTRPSTANCATNTAQMHLIDAATQHQQHQQHQQQQQQQQTHHKYATMKSRSRQFSAGSSSSGSDNSLPPIGKLNNYQQQQQHNQQQLMNSNNRYQQQQQQENYENGLNNNYESPLSSPSPTAPATSAAAATTHDAFALGASSSASSMTASMKMSKFCHECGAKFVIEQAKFCMDCGVRRIVL